MTVRLSERFPAMTPLSLRKERAVDVFRLITRFNRMSARENERENKRTITVRGKKMVRKPAGDDWW